MPQLAENRKASFDYEIIEKYEAGLVLLGHEVKSIKAGQLSLRGSFISVRSHSGQPELYLIGCQVSPYKNAGHLPEGSQLREKKLLLRRSEIAHLVGRKQTEGLTLIPLKIYTNHSFLKLEFAVARGKKKYDKREAIKKRDIERSLRSLTKRR
jgi:SsrA-binding protein